MTDSVPKVEISPLSQEFTDERITVDVQIYKIDGNDRWTLEVVIDEQTSIVWTEVFANDYDAWEECSEAVQAVGLRRLLDGEDDEEATIH